MCRSHRTRRRPVERRTEESSWFGPTKAALVADGRSFRGPGTAQRLVQRGIGGSSIGPSLRQLNLRLELGTLGVEHLKKVGHTAGESKAGQLRRSLAGRRR